MIGGGTTWDNSLMALAGLLAEWDSGDSYQTRVQDLFGDRSGGMNGNYLLDPQTVLRDTAIVQFFGDKNGGDWFWFTAGLKSPDRFSGVVSSEAATFE